MFHNISALPKDISFLIPANYDSRQTRIVDRFRPSGSIQPKDYMNRILISLFLITSLFLIFACERKGGPGAGGNSGPIVVGYYGDLTGRTSNFGQSTKNGVAMAIDEINKAGGVDGRQIQVISEDDEGRPEKAATVVTKLINQDRVIAYREILLAPQSHQ